MLQMMVLAYHWGFNLLPMPRMKPRSALLLFLFFRAMLPAQEPFIIILGTAQDGGFPHLGCTKPPCQSAWNQPGERRNVVSLALVSPQTKQWWLFEATPDIREQLQLFRVLSDSVYDYLPAGIFITHAHIGHYTGLMQLGREVLNTKNIPVYVLPRMSAYLQQNGPWSQLVQLQNIQLQQLTADSSVEIATNIRVRAFTVPHRDEFSETAGFRIEAGERSYLFVPDIDKWEKWSRSIRAEIADVDVALVDGTFFQDGELPNRSMKDVPHPFVQETMSILKDLPESERNKVWFIHFNHTNPLLWDEKTRKSVRRAGFNVAEQGMKI
jgi:pyrroloquinoline quinone biosynthesis protein B